MYVCMYVCMCIYIYIYPFPDVYNVMVYNCYMLYICMFILCIFVLMRRDPRHSGGHGLRLGHGAALRPVHQKRPSGPPLVCGEIC